MKTSAESQERNRAVKSRITTTRRKLYEAVAGGNKTEAGRIFGEYCSVLDKAVKQGTIKKNNSSRRKSRAAARLAALA
jgi:small subunit ribosomal protein S20